MDDDPAVLAPRWVAESDIAPRVLAMRENWKRRWPGSRVADESWLARTEKSHLRLHTLPQGKRYPSSSVEYATILHRHSVILRELLSLSGLNAGEPLVVLTRSWSESPDAAPRDGWVERLVPASLLVSYTDGPEETGEDPTWTHTYVSEMTVLDNALTSLLILLADDKTASVAIMPSTLEWIYSPYDGGMDIRGLGKSDRDRLESAHSDWLPSADDADWVDVSELHMDIPGWEFQTWHLTEASARRLAELAGG